MIQRVFHIDANDFDDLGDEVAGKDFEAIDSADKKRDEGDDESKSPFMFFDFRCAERWPLNVELLSPEAAEVQ